MPKMRHLRGGKACCACSKRPDVTVSAAGSPCRVLSRADKTSFGFKKGPSGSGMKTFVAKGQDWW